MWTHRVACVRYSFESNSDALMTWLGTALLKPGLFDFYPTFQRAHVLACFVCGSKDGMRHHLDKY